MTLFLIILLLQPNLPDRNIFYRSSGYVSKKDISFDTTCLFDILHYDLSIELDMPGIDFLDAFTEITAVSKVDSLDCVDLNFCGMQTDSVFADGSPATAIIHGTGPNQQISIYLPEPAWVDDTFRVKIFYHGTPENGVYYSPFNYGLTYVMSIPWDWTDFPIGARYWFPCHDAFCDKATSAMSVIIPTGYEVVSNGRFEGADTLDSKVRYHYHETYPIPTWYIVFAVSDYAVISDSFVYGDSVMPVYYWPAQWDSAYAHIAFSNVPDILTYFSDLFGDRYPFFEEKYGYVKLPPVGWAMENQTNVFWGLNIPGNHYYEMVVAHEASHQWWGCSLTPYSLKDIWLNEGFATYCEALYSEHWEDGVPYHEYMSDIMDYYLSHENNPLGHPYPMYDPPDGAVWTATTYEKGACVLHMLRHLLGDSLFFDALRAYYDLFKYSNVTTSQFQTVMETVSRQDLDWFFQEWVYMAGHPEYECRWDCQEVASDSYLVNLNVLQTQSDEWNVPVFKMPVDIFLVKASGDTSFYIIWDSLRTQDFQFIIENEATEVLFDPEDWILKSSSIIELVEEPSSDNILPMVTIYPNPFSTKTIIDIRHKTTDQNQRSSDSGLRSSVCIYDITGRLVRSLPLPSSLFSSHQLTWDGRDEFDRKLCAGIYFLKVEFESEKSKYQKTKKLIYIP